MTSNRDHWIRNFHAWAAIPFRWHGRLQRKIDRQAKKIEALERKVESITHAWGADRAAQKRKETQGRERIQGQITRREMKIAQQAKKIEALENKETQGRERIQGQITRREMKIEQQAKKIEALENKVASVARTWGEGRDKERFNSFRAGTWLRLPPKSLRVFLDRAQSQAPAIFADYKKHLEATSYAELFDELFASERDIATKLLIRSFENTSNISAFGG